MPGRGAEAFNHFQGNEARDGRGHEIAAPNHGGGGEHALPGYHGGGGHPVVGAISLKADEAEKAQKLAREIAEELSSSSP